MLQAKEDSVLEVGGGDEDDVEVSEAMEKWAAAAAAAAGNKKGDILW